MANVAAFLSLTKESNTVRVPQLITTNCGVHWILPTKENGGRPLPLGTGYVIGS